VEQNTFATSIYVAASVDAAEAYLANGDSLTEFTLFSRMRERIDEHTWLGTASGYQHGLYYHVRRRSLREARVVEWHCGVELGKYYHVYPIFLFEARYFDHSTTDRGTYYHWISFTDPARRTPMITQGLATVHRSEARAFKAQVERRAGHRRAVAGPLELHSHTIYVDAPLELAVEYLSDPAHLTEWGYMMRRDGNALFDQYDRPIDVALTTHDMGAYKVIEYDVHDRESNTTMRSPMVIVPASYAFAVPEARGVILHRISAWPPTGQRDYGKVAPGDYDTEAINTKRILEAKAGNLASYARGCSYG